MKTIFIVDDSDTNLSTAETALEDDYNIMTMPSAAKMFLLLEKKVPDLILLDIEMPEMDGFQTIKKLKSNELWSDIPVMFLTGRIDTEIEAKGFDLGAIDFITKPFFPPVLIHRIKTQLDIDGMIRDRTAQLHRLQNSIMSVLANMLENHEKGTIGHIERISEYIKILIDGMKERSIYIDEISKWDIEKIISSVRLHDLGKISITDILLNKPEKSKDSEYEMMKTNAMEGERIIDEIIAQTGEGEFLHNARLFAGSYRERWDGKGYPHGLKGLEIPLHGRIMAIVDIYDTIVSEKSIEKTFNDEEAVQFIMQNVGTHYDPLIAEVFFEVKDKLKAVRIGK
jgi:putative two-component system response regulator